MRAISAANTTLVSRSADTGPIGARSIAQITMPYASAANTPPHAARRFADLLRQPQRPRPQPAAAIIAPVSTNIHAV